MKLIIDIDDESYRCCQATKEIDDLQIFGTSKAIKAIAHGTVLADKTHGEVIKEIYRHHSDMNCGSNGEYVHIWSNDGKCQMTIHKDFWNSPYRAERERGE